jgi:hypothetical protein
MNPDLTQPPQPASRADRRREEGHRRATAPTTTARGLPEDSGRARAGRPAVGPSLIAGLVALAGLALVIVGALQATVLASPAVTEATLSSPSAPVVSTAVGVLGLKGPRLEVTASGDPGKPVFLGIGRARDVDAYLASAKRQEITGYDGKTALVTRPEGTEATLPDPSVADVWVVSSLDQGKADLVWPDTGGQWRLVAATDGTAPAPAGITLTWSGEERHSTAPVLIAIGVLLLVGGSVTALMLASRARLEREEREEAML